MNTLIFLETGNIDLKYLAFECDFFMETGCSQVFEELIALFLSITYYSYIQQPEEIFFCLSTFQSLCLDLFLLGSDL